MTDIRSLYGTRELSTIGFGCDEVNNILHLNSEHIYLEVLDEGGYPCLLGSYGKLTFSSLSNVSMPLIRYQPGDRGRFVGGACSCGVTLPRFELIGRESEFITLPENKEIPVWALYGEIFGQGRIDKIIQYQLRQDSLDTLTICLKVKESWSDEDSKSMRGAIGKKIGKRLKVELNFNLSNFEGKRKRRAFVGSSLK